MKSHRLLILCALFWGCSSQQIQQSINTLNESIGATPGGLSSVEVSAGLKEALVKGTDYAVDLSSANDGFYKNARLFIPFPAEAEKVKETALKLGLNSQVEKFEETLNHAAEESVKAAKPIFVEAITKMTVEDAFGLLKGGDRAATEFLRRKTSSDLYTAFKPKVQEAVDKVELTKYYNPLANAYNTSTLLTGGDEVDADLTKYVTDKTIDGLFILIGDEEKKIREDPAARVTDLLKKVFGAQ